MVAAPFADSSTASGGQIDGATIIQRSTAANDRDFKLAPDFNYKQREKQGGVVKTSQVTMIDGSPYTRLMAVNGKPLSAEKAAEEEQKFRDAVDKREHESPSERAARLTEYRKGRERDHMMMSQLSRAFNFTLLGKRKLRGFTVWVMRATPKPGYQPPNMECQVLTGMEGELWIDQETYEWVKVTAKVIHPVSIGGFLAQVQPGTRFELEKTPVETGVWQITHYSSYANARVLLLFRHQENDEVTYFDFEPIKPGKP